jgi:acetoin utilization deacetylase AcuC-like enzyme
MRLFYDPQQLEHAPLAEMHNGGFAPYREHPARVENVLAAIGRTEQPADFGLAPLAAVHTPEYLSFLQSAHDAWIAAAREGDALPYVWPVRRRRDLRLERIDARLGRFSFDATTPITAKTWASGLTALGIRLDYAARRDTTPAPITWAGTATSTSRRSRRSTPSTPG